MSFEIDNNNKNAMFYMLNKHKYCINMTDLFDVEKVFGFERDGHALNRHIIIRPWIIPNISPHGKRYRLGLQRDKVKSEK